METLAGDISSPVSAPQQPTSTSAPPILRPQSRSVRRRPDPRPLDACDDEHRSRVCRMSLCLMFQPLSLLKTGGACAAHSGDYEIGARSKDIQRQQLTSVNSFIFVRITKDGEKEQLTSVTYFY